MARTLSILLFITAFSIFSYAQETEELIATINEKAKTISSDRMGNLYLINDYSIKKYDRQGKLIKEYNSKKYGTIHSIDATDPHKILVFFQEYATVLTLDNYLSPIGNSIDLNQLGYDKVSTIARSRDGGFWIYDKVSQKIFRLDSRWEKKYESVMITQWFGNRLYPTEMVEMNDRLYLNDPKFGLFVFDHFAAFDKKINLKQLNQIQVLDNTLYFVMNGEFCIFHIAKLARACKENEGDVVIQQARIEKNRFYTSDGTEIKIFKTN